MRNAIELNDRVRVNETGAIGTVVSIRYVVRSDGPDFSDQTFLPGMLHRVVPIEEVAAEARAESEAAGAAIERAQAMLAALTKEDPNRADMLAELGELAAELAGFIPGVPSALARQIAMIATKIAALVEREASR